MNESLGLQELKPKVSKRKGNPKLGFPVRLKLFS